MGTVSLKRVSELEVAGTAYKSERKNFLSLWRLLALAQVVYWALYKRQGRLEPRKKKCCKTSVSENDEGVQRR